MAAKLSLITGRILDWKMLINNIWAIQSVSVCVGGGVVGDLDPPWKKH